jgi:hypothetical protein
MWEEGSGCVVKRELIELMVESNVIESEVQFIFQLDVNEDSVMECQVGGVVWFCSSHISWRGDDGFLELEQLTSS